MYLFSFFTVRFSMDALKFVYPSFNNHYFTIVSF